jgi:hypothetical protein
MERISEGLDGIQSELRVANALLTQYAKRIFTDRIFIALAALVSTRGGGAISATAREMATPRVGARAMLGGLSTPPPTPSHRWWRASWPSSCTPP